jgi:glycosyltransferase involved in cell wall biosynthesis
MRVLYISEVMPYEKVAHAGGKIFYRYLQQLSHYVDIDILCYCSREESSYVGDLNQICSNIYLVERGVCQKNKILFQTRKYAHAFVKPYISLGYPVNLKIFVKKLREILNSNKYDIVELTFTSSLLYLPIIRKLKPEIKINIVEHDVSYLNLQRSYKYEKGFIKRLGKYIRYKVYKYSEISLLKKCNMVTVLNNKDKQLLLKEQLESGKIHTLPPYFECPDINLKDISCNKIPKSLLFYGALWRRENDESIYRFLKEVFPQILKVDREVKLYIVGNRPSDRVMCYNDNKNVFVTGYIEDPDMYFRNCQVFIAPLLLGAGVKIKVLEAMAYGLPVVSTEIGIEGIEADRQNTCIVVNKIADFSGHILELLKEEALREKLSYNAYNFIRTNYDFKTEVVKMVDKYRKLMNIS